MKTTETLINVHWEGPFDLEKAVERGKDKRYVLYQIYGLHHIYGADVLLYIGMTTVGFDSRLLGHGDWVWDECDPVKVRLGSLKEIQDWEEWYNDEGEEPWGVPPNPEQIHAVEALMIYAHQPAYNTQCKSSAKEAVGYRIFNTGTFGRLYPEFSYFYFFGDE